MTFKLVHKYIVYMCSFLKNVWKFFFSSKQDKDNLELN